MVGTYFARSLFIFVLLIAVGWWWSLPSSDELVVYKAGCSNGKQILPETESIIIGVARGLSWEGVRKKYKADRRNCLIFNKGTTTYVLNRTRGEVYYYGILDEHEKLVDCAILNRTEWTCSYPGGSHKVVIIDGLRAFKRGMVEPPYVDVGFSQRRWQWWFTALYSFVGGTPQGSWLIPEQQAYGAW